MARHLLVTIPTVLSLALLAACSTKTDSNHSSPETSSPGTTPCACAGVEVPEGTVDAACGASVCVSNVGYRCAEDGQSAEPDPDACPKHWSGGSGGATGLAEKKLEDDDGKSHTYAINVPDSYTGDTGVPLLMHFHGWRPAPAGVKDEIEYVWKDVGDKEGFIAVAPEGEPCPSLNPNGEPYLCFDEERDDAWVLKLLDTVTSKYNVDRDRIFLSGHSGGTYFVEAYGLVHADKFRAVAGFSGGCVTDGDNYINSCSKYKKLVGKAARKTPYYLLHNPGDHVVPPSWSKNMNKTFTEAGVEVKTYFKTYNGGSTGHSIDPTLIPDVWTWLASRDPSFVAAE